MIETRLINEMQRDLDKKEGQVYKRHQLESQWTYN